MEDVSVLSAVKASNPKGKQAMKMPRKVLAFPVVESDFGIRTHYLDYRPDLVPGRGGLVVKSWIWDRRLSDSKPDATEDRHVLGLEHAKSYVEGQTSSHWCNVEVWRGGSRPGVALVI
ncbi:hypothetical protein AVEN_81267-1 [Araneus ventricosus]|uniref:Uncharacterized protein n=1 Tax=Araneus ventricosus TaxID=182803 RepID=A0A4Y2FF77_ARAVE|nr:hypothetical protein AVEN_81267-1 [Araneus ventricosus]